MTIKEQLAVMDDIRKKNNATWSKYATQRCPGWTWEPPMQQRFRPFDTIGEKVILAGCVAFMLVLFVLMA